MKLRGIIDYGLRRSVMINLAAFTMECLLDIYLRCLYLRYLERQQAQPRLMEGQEKGSKLRSTTH